MKPIEIANNGKEITETNYWDHKIAAEGKLFFSINAGCIRVLVPDIMAPIVDEMKTGKYAIVSRGPWLDAGRDDGLEIIFEDKSDAPYMIHTGVEQWDMVPATKDAGKGWRLSVWTKSGKQFEIPCRYRLVAHIPWMKPWS